MIWRVYELKFKVKEISKSNILQDRYAGKTTIEAINRIKTSNHTEYRSPFNPR